MNELPRVVCWFSCGSTSAIATKMALNLSDYVITEGGFASELGAEKFFDIVCPTADIKPDVAVLVCSIKALNLQGGSPKKDYSLKKVGIAAENTRELLRKIMRQSNYMWEICKIALKYSKESDELKRKNRITQGV